MDIINVNVGEVGARIGDQFLRKVHSQHFSGKEPSGQTSTFFAQYPTGNHPRSLLLGIKEIHSNLQSPTNSIQYSKNNIISAKTTSFGIYGETKYNYPLSFKENMQSQLHKQMESCDNLGGFLLISSTSGGTGSGLSANVVTYLREMSPSKTMQSFRMFPAFNQYCHPIEIYNTTFSINFEVQNCDMSLIFNSSAPTHILAAEGRLKPSLQQINQKIGSTIADTTLPFRFKGDLNTSQRKIASNMVLFPRMHFLNFSKSTDYSLKPLSSALNSNNFFLNNSLEKQPDLSFFTVYAGVRMHSLSQNDAINGLKSEFQRKSYNFVPWIADNIHLSLHEPVGPEHIVLFINSFHIRENFKTISEKFTASFRRKAFIHSYLAAGMDEMQFTEAESNMNDLFSEYQPPSEYYPDQYDEQAQIIEE